MQSPIDIMYLTTTIATVFMLALLLSSANAFSYNFRGVDVKLRGTISETYDDNISFLKDNTKADLITGLTFGLGAEYEGKTHSLELMGNVTQEIFADNSNFNNTSQDLTLNFKNEFSKYDRISLKNIFTHAYEPRSFEDAFGRRGGRYSYFRNKFDLEYTKDITKQFSLTTSFRNEIDAFSRKDIRDSFLNRVGIEGDYYYSSATIFLLSYYFTNRKFEHGEDASTHRFAPGVRQYITKRLYFDGKAGMDFIDSYDGKHYVRPLIFASLTNNIDVNTSASISFSKEYYTNPYVQDLFNYWQTSGQLTRQIRKRLRCSLSGFFGEGEYPALKLKDKLKGARVGFTYDIRENIKGNLTYNYSNVDSTIVGNEYVKNTILLGLTAEF